MFQCPTGAPTSVPRPSCSNTWLWRSRLLPAGSARCPKYSWMERPPCLSSQAIRPRSRMRFFASLKTSPFACSWAQMRGLWCRRTTPGVIMPPGRLARSSACSPAGITPMLRLVLEAAPVLRDQAIIGFAGEDWWYHHPHSKNHIMKRLARAGNKVLFINSISMGLPSLSNPDLFAKIRRKLSSYARFLRRTEDGIIVVSPLVLPFYSSPIGRRLNQLLLLVQIKLLMVYFDLREPILWIAIPTANQLVGKLGERALVYQVSDKYEANQMDHATSAEVIRSMQVDLLSRADLVYYSGRKLYQEALLSNPEAATKSKLLEQAVDFEHFAQATADPNI